MTGSNTFSFLIRRTLYYYEMSDGVQFDYRSWLGKENLCMKDFFGCTYTTIPVFVLSYKLAFNFRLMDLYGSEHVPNFSAIRSRRTKLESRGEINHHMLTTLAARSEI